MPNIQRLCLFLHLFPFNIRCWTFDVRCSFFLVKPPCAPAQGILTVSQNGGTRRSNNPPSPRLWRVTTPFIPVLPHGAFWRRRVNLPQSTRCKNNLALMPPTTPTWGVNYQCFSFQGFEGIAARELHLSPINAPQKIVSTPCITTPGYPFGRKTPPF